MNKKISWSIFATIILIISAVLIFPSSKQKVSMDTTKVRIAYLANSVNALPLYLAVEKGYFKNVGLDVEAIKFDAPNQIFDALISGNADFAAPSSATGLAAILQIKNPGVIKIFALNGSLSPNNVDNALLIRKDSEISSIKDLMGKKLGILPGIQFKTIAQQILSVEGLEINNDVSIVELGIPLQLQALTSGQIDAILTLEPVRTIGEMKNLTKNLAVAPINLYVSDPWYGGGGIASVKFMQSNPNTAKSIISVFDKAIKEISTDPNSSRQYLKNYTPLNDEQITAVPLPIWKMYSEFSDKDISSLQRFFDIFYQFKVVENMIDAKQIIYSN